MPDPVRFARTAGVWMLVVFHAALFARRLAQPESLDATAALRWAGTFAIFAIAFALRASAARLSRRQLLALALAAIALHAPVFQGAPEAGRAAEFWVAFPALLAPVLAFCAMAALGRTRLVGRALLRFEPFAPRCATSRTPLSPRPPPVL